MCTVTIKVDETLLRTMMPELDSTAAIRKWAQQLIDLRVQEMVAGDSEMIDLETMREDLHRMVREVYSQQ